MLATRRPSHHPRRFILLSVAAFALLLPGTFVVAAGPGSVDTDFTVTIEGLQVTLTATGGDDVRETGSFAVYRGSTVVVEGEYDITAGQVVTFGPYTLPAGSYLLVWDSEPGHDPGQSHRELAFEVVGAQPTVAPTGSALPTSGVNPTEKPNVTLPPTDLVLDPTPGMDQPAIWVMFLLGLVAGIAFLLTPRRPNRRGR
jgi:hypothetical protein